MKSTLLVTLMLGLGLAMPSMACPESHAQGEKPVATQEAAHQHEHAMKADAAQGEQAPMQKKCKCKEGKPCKEMQEGKKCKCMEKKGCPVKEKAAEGQEAAAPQGEAPKKSCCPH